jgi:NADPH:quinone reductase
MKAIGDQDAGPIPQPNALAEFTAQVPQLGPNDLLVEVRGISVNPVDVKLRGGVQPDGGPRILGFDAAGIVQATGPGTTHFHPGDAVY